MSLRTKAISIVFAVVAVTSIGIYLVSLRVIQEKFDRLEERRVRLNLERIENSLRHETEHLEALADDYATWDSTYRFLGRTYPQFATSDISDQSLTGYNLQFFLVVSSSGKVALCRDYLQRDSRCGDTDTLNQLVGAAHTLSGPQLSSAGSGVLLLRRGSALLAVHPVLRTDGTGPPRGLLLVGKLVADRTALSLAHLLAFPIQVMRPDDPDSRIQRVSQLASVSGTDRTYVEWIDNEHIAAFAQIDDIAGKPAMLLRTELTRDLHHEGALVQRVLFAEMLAIVLLMATAAFWVLQKAIIKPISALSRTAVSITMSRDLSARAAVNGNDEFTNLSRAFNTMLDELETSRKELLVVQEALEYRLGHDALTGVLSRNAIVQELTSESARCLRQGMTCAVMMADLDGFKQINDIFGHAAGDEALRRASDIMRRSLRPYDRLGRYGGDEFLILAGSIGRDDAIRLADRIRSAVTCALGGQFSGCTPTISIGVTLLDGDADWREVVSTADEALYRAKQSGRNRVEFLAPHSTPQVTGTEPPEQLRTPGTVEVS